MKLNEVFNQLSGTELALLSIGGQPQGVINSKNQGVVLNALNLGLTALHSRFALKEGRLKLILVPDVYLYTLKSAFALDNDESTEPLRYIEGEFLDDLAKVEAIYTEEGNEVALNTRTKYACLTPSTHALRVPAPIVDQDVDIPSCLKTNALELVYRATHPTIAADEFGQLDVEEVEVDLPYAYLEPLLYFIAGRIHHPNGMSGDMQMGSSYAAKYENACRLLEGQNLQTDKGEESTRFERRGWV